MLVKIMPRIKTWIVRFLMFVRLVSWHKLLYKAIQSSWHTKAGNMASLVSRK